MTAIEINKKLIENFGDDIIKTVKAYENELYLEIKPDRIRELSGYINHEMGYPLVSMFANDETSLIGKYAVYYAFADRVSGILLILKIGIEPEQMTFESIAGKVHAAARYEREIKDLFGLNPVGHPNAKRLVFHGNWPRETFPLRKAYDLKHRPDFAKEKINFSKVISAGVFEIPVGPVHAGIIEPGHFRFSVAGEPIINLEAQLYFVHKGIEKLCEGESLEKCLFVAERISGDESFTNAYAYCQAIEKIAGLKIPERAEYIRVVFAELERLTSHLGDLGGICTDVAYGFAASQFKMMRGWAYGIADELCGMRFLRGVNRLGGVRKDFVAGKEASLIRQLKKIRSEFEETEVIIKANSFFIDRVENTGILSAQIAADLNAVGPPARAAGIRSDVRKSFPNRVYRQLSFAIPEHHNGDVNCRMNVKIEECYQAIDLMLAAIDSMPAGRIRESITTVAPYQFAFGMTEAPRGENIHWVMTGENNTIFRYKIRTPSFCNWPALCHAVKGNLVPDFPLINKSFNLSYAGNDL
ncbi:NADH-quinone oxidoreductase subunit C [Acetobacterium fimetarium]|uniref:hydrogenase large subunit n=1 Tax=Acetobacterium fimetarium TaxID=52691 RepID=UPI001FAD0536|nr:NADH-quinone oxidoreductase subunit C [Acetobacterium fimetarium]